MSFDFKWQLRLNGILDTGEYSPHLKAPEKLTALYDLTQFLLAEPGHLTTFCLDGKYFQLESLPTLCKGKIVRVSFCQDWFLSERGPRLFIRPFNDKAPTIKQVFEAAQEMDCPEGSRCAKLLSLTAKTSQQWQSNWYILQLRNAYYICLRHYGAEHEAVKYLRDSINSATLTKHPELSSFWNPIAPREIVIGKDTWSMSADSLLISNRYKKEKTK